MQQKQILNMQQGLICQYLLKNVDLANLKSNFDKLDINKLKNVPTNLSNFKIKVDELDVNKLRPAPLDLSKPSDAIKMMLIKKMYIILRLKILKIKYLILLT